MPTFIHLVSYTSEGIEHMNESPERLEAAREVADSVGGDLSQFFLTLGGYDAVAVGEYPDAEAAARAAITIAGEGAVRTETLRAFTEDEYRDVVDQLP
ncbi:GYD domain-containing protein [Halomarina ordinaria]|uniref:GYD domain-containing protein n=1 Tax=Halomarina ordinaria TaxID=3033939 RepID=A0ABD5UG57_9EURY|nr:GYD domain-containing protein [Halomarina sp. PSRA2]